ncbi:MAG: hypothetical protein KF760_26980 [Candidatus Eremiobacteraeota bacterium]|nr:hypothetical protein [Candidatus Eremiobacteraeota bacterium]MCW5869615.1 hypothetical protein [Candidatus Eremiobacteraeota bacterium]
MLRRWMIGLGLAAGSLGLARALPGPEKFWELRQRTPHFETKVGRALVSVGTQNPGLAASLARHLLEDLGEEPLQALGDVHADLQARYPGFDKELAGLLEQGRQKRRQFRQGYPRLRSWFLGRLQAMPEPPTRPGVYLSQHHPRLLVGLALSASQLVDEKYPELPARWSEQKGHQGFAPFLLENYPDFFSQFVRRLSTEQRQEIRQAALGYLKEREAWALRQPAGRVQEGYEDLLERFPGIAESWGEARVQAFQGWREKFPELRQVVMESLRSKHPDLLEKARHSVDKHFPELRGQLHEACQRELLSPP